MFGTRVAGAPYVVRPSAYALIENVGGAVAVIRTPQGAYLPGGGMEADETPQDTVRREAREEGGLIVEPKAFAGRAIEIVYSPEENICYEKRCEFLVAELTDRARSHESGHELI